MTADEILRKISSLHPEGQRQVLDFIAFIRQRYGRSREAENNPSNIFFEDFAGVWRDRSDLNDSSEWIRHQRKIEWTK